MYRIGEFAGFFGISIKTLRIYDRIGLLKPDRTDKETGYRYYTPEQVQTLNAIIELKSIGFSLKEIKDIIMSGMKADFIIEMLDKKLAFWIDNIISGQYKVNLIKQMRKEIKYSNKQRLRSNPKESNDSKTHRMCRLVCLQDNHADRRLAEMIWV